MSEGKIIFISDSQSITITSGYVQFPNGDSTPIIHGNLLRERLINFLNKAQAKRDIWEQIAHIIGYDVSQFLKYKYLPWRNGRSQGRTIYYNNQLCGMMDTPELAAKVVAALNEKEP